MTVPGSGGLTPPFGPFGAFTGAILGSPASVGSGKYLTTYQVDNLSGFAYGTGSFITFDDITGFISAQSIPANWGCSFELNGPNAPNTLPTDSLAILNASCMYTGPAVAAGSAGSVADFTFLTDTAAPPPAYFSSEVFGDGSSSPDVNNQVVGLVGADVVPTPEPATAGPCLAFVMATMLFGLVKRRRLRSMPAAGA